MDKNLGILKPKFFPTPQIFKNTKNTPKTPKFYKSYTLRLIFVFIAI